RATEQQDCSAGNSALPEHTRLVEESLVIPSCNVVRLTRMLDSELLLRNSDRFRIEVSQSGTRHDFRRNILADGEQSARFLWVLTERGLAAANPHPRSAVESHRLATRRRDAEHNNAAIR